MAHLTENERHRLLTAERRRLALKVLEGQTTPIHLADLASEIAEQETGLDAEDREAVKRVKITLRHTHLPMMDELGVLEYDIDSNQIGP